MQKRTKDLKGVQHNFSQEDKRYPHHVKKLMSYYSTTQARDQTTTEDQTLSGSKSLQCVATVTLQSKRKLLLDISHVPKIGTLVCSPYPTRQVSKSWHTFDGVFPKNKGKAKVTILLQNAVSLCYIQTPWVNQLRMTKPTYNLSLDHYHDRVQNCSRSSNKTKQTMIQITLPVVIIGELVTPTWYLPLWNDRTTKLQVPVLEWN